MASDDDLPGLLPDRPPPSPARREAAIAEALRRFDGAPEAVPARRPMASWSRRPWVGGLAAASLALVIGVPLAWQQWNRGNPAVTDPSARAALNAPAVVVQGAPRSDFAGAGPAAERPAAVATPSLAPRPPEPANAPAAPALVAPSPAMPVVAAPAPAPEAQREERIDRPAEAYGSARGAVADVASNRPKAPLPPAPPPPAPAAAAPTARMAASAAVNKAMSEDSAEVIVTGARRSRSRSAPQTLWSTCTPDDPRQNLAACRREVDPGARGARGQAAAHLADGLSAIWAGNQTRGIAAFDRALSADPGWALGWLNRGLARQAAGDESGALADFDRAVRLAPFAARGWYVRSRLRAEMGDARRARADRERAIELDPDFADLAD